MLQLCGAWFKSQGLLHYCGAFCFLSFPAIPFHLCLLMAQESLAARPELPILSSGSEGDDHDPARWPSLQLISSESEVDDRQPARPFPLLPAGPLRRHSCSGRRSSRSPVSQRRDDYDLGESVRQALAAQGPVLHLAMPRARTSELTSGLFGNFSFGAQAYASVARPATSDPTLLTSHCLSAIEMIVSSVQVGECRYKIGLTASPVVRFQYYSNIGAWRMFVLCSVRGASAAAAMEQRLICRFRSDGRCANRAPGGEGAGTSQGTTFYIYVVVGGLL